MATAGMLHVFWRAVKLTYRSHDLKWLYVLNRRHHLAMIRKEIRNIIVAFRDSSDLLCREFLPGVYVCYA
jgi:hypothetical protein